MFEEVEFPSGVLEVLLELESHAWKSKKRYIMEFLD
jgi:hypothetical protein